MELAVSIFRHGIDLPHQVLVPVVNNAIVFAQPMWRTGNRLSVKVTEAKNTTLSGEFVMPEAIPSPSLASDAKPRRLEVLIILLLGLVERSSRRTSDFDR